MNYIYLALVVIAVISLILWIKSRSMLSLNTREQDNSNAVEVFEVNTRASSPEPIATVQSDVVSRSSTRSAARSPMSVRQEELEAVKYDDGTPKG